MPKSPARVALIGVSGYARVHLGFLEELSAAGVIQLAAVTVVNPQEERATVDRLRALGCEIFGDHRAMLERRHGRLDLCCIPTGIPLHTPMTIAALEAGAHVLVEKPLAPQSSAVAAIRAAEARTGRWVAVGFQDLYVAENQGLQRRLLAGAIGPLTRIVVRGLWPRDSGYYRRNNWAGRARLDDQGVFDSPLSNAFSHFVNLALFLAGDAPGRSAAPTGAEGWLLRAQPIENFDTAAVRVATATGVELLIFLSHSSASELEPELLLEGSSGRAHWLSGREIRLEPAGAPPTVTALPNAEITRRTMFQQVVGRLADPARFICGTAIAGEHTRACELVQLLPIEPVDADQIERTVTAEGAERRCIRGLEAGLARAWAARKLPAEIFSPHDPQSFHPFRSIRADPLGGGRFRSLRGSVFPDDGFVR